MIHKSILLNTKLKSFVYRYLVEMSCCLEAPFIIPYLQLENQLFMYSSTKHLKNKLSFTDFKLGATCLLSDSTCYTENMIDPCWLEADVQSDRLWSRIAVLNLFFGMLFGLLAEPKCISGSIKITKEDIKSHATDQSPDTLNNIISANYVNKITSKWIH